MSDVSEQVDVVVVGAGWRGIIAAKTYTQVRPEINLVVLESQSSFGGTWAEERLYPGLKSNTTLGSFEYSDLPMSTEVFGVKHTEHIPAHVICDYLNQYVDKFDIRRRARFNTKVDLVERLNTGQWRLATDNGSTLLCDKLILATGLTSEPFLPIFPGREAFNAPLLHAKELTKKATELVKSGATSVVVCGARKSAHDAVHFFGSSGVKVHWVIRESGHGPSWLASTEPEIPGLALDQIVLIRFASWLSPCIWAGASGYSWIRGLFHGTRPGQWFVRKFWKMVTNTVLEQNQYDSHPKLQKLKPRCDVFWTGSSAGGLNFDTNFWELVKSDNVEIYRADITSLSDHTVHLSSGEAISTDALICCTGWKDTPPCEFLPQGIDRKLGIPHPITASPQDLRLNEMETRAESEILRRFPILGDQPSLTGDPSIAIKERCIRPYQLYRFLVPPNDEFGRSVAFLGMLGTPAASEIQALWSVAYLTGDLTLDTKTPKERASCGATLADEMLWDTVRASVFCRLRAPAGYGGRWPDLTFDLMPYYDMLLGDLGLRFRRKKSWWREWFSPYTAQDYRGIVDEWIARMRSTKAKAD